MAEYNDDFKFFVCLNEEELLKHWVELASIETEINEAGYNFMVFYNGVWIGGDNYPECNGSMYPDYDTPENDELERYLAMFHDLDRKVKETVVVIKEERRLKSMSAHQRQKEAEAKQKEAHERKLLASLKQKYGE